MNDDLTPDPLDAGDPFAASLADRLHGAADGLDGAGVTQAGVAAAVTGRRRSVRTRAVAGGIAAAVVLLGAVAVAGPFRGDQPERIAAGGPTATGPCTRTASISDPAGWLRLTADQAVVLQQVELLTAEQVAASGTHATLLTFEDLGVLNDAQIGPIGEQLFELGDQEAVVGYLRSGDLLTEAQVQQVTAGRFPVLDQGQADAVLDHFPELDAITAGGEPISDTPTSSEPVTTTTEVPTTQPAPSSTGQTPFEQWAEVLRAAGLLTAEQEDEIAAGRGISLTPEQSRVLQAYWDEQAGIPATTVLAVPTPTPSAGPVEVPCEGDGGSGTTLPAASPPETTTTVAASDDPPVTTTSVASSDGPAATTTTVAASDDPPPATTTAPVSPP